ncbi:FAS1 domain-containing protein [Pholiota conissans]|uniref:FAS1 domain-containing protein n=1 Tax=Pholiota conissans TaxID=109636 RepID=A0A9P5YLJ3_9AGAR|nr:FAS1 domain-containing protein [Pholiota conissans]
MFLKSLSISLVLSLLLGPISVLADGNFTAFLSQYVSALQSAGFSGIANALEAINGTTVGEQLLSRLANTTNNYTVFVPDNDAVRRIPTSISSNASFFAEYISYHIVEGDFTNTTNSSSSGGGSSSTTSSVTSSTSTSSGSTSSASATTAALFGRLFAVLPRAGSGSSNPQPYAGIYPNVTIGRTLLNSSDLVHLEGNQSQVLAWTRYTPDGNVTMLNQASFTGQNISITNSTTWRNLFINGINGVLIPPGNFSSALNATNTTALTALLSTVQLPVFNGTNETAIGALQNATGITYFVPNNLAFTSDVNSTLQGLQSNTSALQTVVQNHYINGTSLYSTLIDNSTTAVSAAGENLTFFVNSTGTFINGANNTVAQIVRPDVLLDNGVAHIINGVLFSTDSDPAVASSAYQSATSVAAQSTTETGPIAASTTTQSSTTSSTTASQTTSA